MVPATATPRSHRAVSAPTATLAKAKDKPAESNSIIVKPKAGTKVTKHALKIKVRAKHGIVRAKLNKVKLSRFDFVWQSGLFYTLAASASHGLKHKKNTLTVVVGNGKAGQKKQRIEFTVNHKKPLTGAGRDVTVQAGSTIVLPGRVRLHPDTRKKSKKAGPDRTAMTWSVVRAPGQDPELKPNSKDNLRLDTERAGRYVLAAVGKYNGVQTTDTVTVDAASAPILNFDSFASTGGTPGIQVGQTVYQAYGPLDRASWQVLILHRHTGAVLNNWTYGVCTDNANFICRSDKDGSVRRFPPDDLKDLDNGTRMVVAVHHQAFSSYMGNPAAYFSSIGAPKDYAPTGPTALIGLPDWGPGQAWRASSQRGLKGVLQWDTNKNFTFISGDRTAFDTRAGGGCGPDTCTVTMTVGEQPKTYSVPKSGGGFAVQVYDRTTLGFISGQVFDLTGYPGQVTDRIAAMISYINSIPKGALVMVASVGGPDQPRMGRPSMPSKVTYGFGGFATMELLGKRVVADLATAVADLGGTRHAFLQSTRTPGDNYSLVGWKGLGETRGSEVHSKKGRLSGALVRDNDNRFETANVTEDDDAQELITNLVTAAPKPDAWPGTGNPQYLAALDDLSKRVGIGPDPRSAYWSRNEALDNGNPQYWVDRSNQAKALNPPAQGFDVGIWRQAQKDFVQELIWVGTVRQYFVWFKHPYLAGNQLSAWIKATNIATTLRTSDDFAKNQKVNIDWMEIFSVLIEAVAPWAGFASKAVEKAIHIIAGLAAAALEYGAMGLANKESGEQITEKDEQEVKALEVETKVVDRMQTTSKSYDRMADIIVSDYAKLSKMGDLTACNVENRTCDPGFETMTNDSFDRMSVSAQRTAEQTVFKELLPIAWPVNRIPTTGYYSGDGYPQGNWNARRYECYSASLFNDLPDRANNFTVNDLQYQLTSYLGNGLLTPQFQVYVIGEINSRNNVITPSDTKANDKAILGRMFKPMSESFDVSDGGLGIDPGEYMTEVDLEGRARDYDLTCGGWDYSNNNTAAPVN